MRIPTHETEYFVIYDWMVLNLKLFGNNLLVYAIIYNYCQQKEWFSKSIGYLAKWTNSTKQGIIKNLKYLCQYGFLQKKEEFIDNTKICYYKPLLSEEV